MPYHADEEIADGCVDVAADNVGAADKPMQKMAVFPKQARFYNYEKLHRGMGGLNARRKCYLFWKATHDPTAWSRGEPAKMHVDIRNRVRMIPNIRHARRRKEVVYE